MCQLWSESDKNCRRSSDLKKKLTTDIHPPISHPAAEVKTNNSPVAVGNRLIITHFMFYFVPKSYCRYAAISYNKAIVLPAKYDSKQMPYDVRCIIIDFVHYNYNMLYFETLITKWFIHYMYVHNINVRSFNAIDNECQTSTDRLGFSIADGKITIYLFSDKNSWNDLEGPSRSPGHWW